MKEKEVEELNKKKKQAKSKKKKLEMFKECRARLNSMIVDWKETPGRDEDTSYGVWKENVMKERMDKMLDRHGMNVENVRNVDVDVDIVGGRQPHEDDRKTVTGKKDDSLVVGRLCLKKKTE